MTTKASTTKGASKAPAGNVTAEQIAATVGATGKDFRRWLRADLRANGRADDLAGKGGRYTFSPAAAARIVTLYGERKARNANASASDYYAPTKAPRAPRKASPVVKSTVAPIGALEAPSASQN